ncbi:MAG: sulfotransferase [Bacteroidota bacterium]
MKVIDVLKSFYSVNRSHLESLKESRIISRAQPVSDITLYEHIHTTTEPVFALSTGRSGTKLLTELFSLSAQNKVYHEPTPEFTWHSKYAYEHQTALHNTTLQMMFDISRYELIRDAELVGKRFIETNNRVTFFAPHIARLYPKAKFIHLIRDPFEFIASGIPRGWYSAKDYLDEGRIVNPDKEKWNQWSVHQKIAWLWVSTNQFINHFKAETDAVITIRSDELFSNPEHTQTLFAFLGMNPPSETQIKNLIRRPVNKSRKPPFSLSESEKKEISKIITEYDI